MKKTEELFNKWNKELSEPGSLAMKVKNYYFDIGFIDGFQKMYKNIDEAIEIFKSQDCPFELMHCVSTYPCPEEILNLNIISKLKKKYDCNVGYSGHESGVIPSVVAATYGISSLERHITLDKTMDGIDQSSSLELLEFSQLIKFIRESENSIGKPIKKMTRGEILQKEVLGKSLVSRCDIEIGEIFSENNLEVRGPAKGLSPQFFYEIQGKKSNRSIKKGSYLQSDDL